MLLHELLLQKKVLDLKIRELKRIIQYTQSDDLAEELFALIEIRQSKILTIKSINKISKIIIGGTEVDLDVAVRIRDTVEEKIDILTSLINNNDCSLNKIELQSQRDKFYEEFIILSAGITNNDLKIKIGD